MLENKVFDILFCKKAKKLQAGTQVRRLSVGNNLYGSLHGEDIDPDVTTEE